MKCRIDRRMLRVVAQLGCACAAAGLAAPVPAASGERGFRAGAYAMDVTPTGLPVIVNGGFLSKTADKVHDPLHVRWLVMDDGRTRVALGVLDTCLIPREFADEVRARGEKLTGIPAERIMLSATHTHSAPSLMQALGTPSDPAYPAFALPRIVEGLQRAADRLVAARAGWAVVPAPDHTHTRVWIRRPDRLLQDPFGDFTVRANMHPGHQNPDVVGPSGPSDPALTLLAVQSPDGHPLAVLANFSMHYFGSQPVSADYYGAFCAKVGEFLGATNGEPAFVGLLSQGTSGDQHWMDYAQPRRPVSRDAYAGELAQMAADAYRGIAFHDRVPLAMRQKTLRVATRRPDAKRLEWARELVARMNGAAPKNQAEVYAREQLWLHENRTRLVCLQALRVGDLGIAMWPCEVFSLSGLKVKAQSPLQPTMNIELANAEEGYIPPPELFPLGGYNTWACRSAGLVPEAEPRIVETLVRLLEDVSHRSRRVVTVTHGAYAKAVLDSKPLAYWRLEEWAGPTALDATRSRRHAAYEPGIARWLDGPASPAFSGEGIVNRCPHFAGGRVTASFRRLRDEDGYSAEFWFWNGLPETARGVTGHLFAYGGESLAIGGTNAAPGRLVFGRLSGRTVLAPRTWHHVVLTRDQEHAVAWLDGQPEPELSGCIDPAAGAEQRTVFIGGRDNREATFEGRIDEVALYGRVLPPDEIAAHHRAAQVQ